MKKLFIPPPKDGGKPKKGHLCFDAAFETGHLLYLIMFAQRLICMAGNLGRVDLITAYEYDLFIRPDTCNPRYRSDTPFLMWWS